MLLSGMGQGVAVRELDVRGRLAVRVPPNLGASPPELTTEPRGRAAAAGPPVQRTPARRGPPIIAGVVFGRSKELFGSGLG